MYTRLALGLALVLIAPHTGAQMYKCVDARGVTHYTDKPLSGCKGGEVNIQGSPPISGTLAAPKPPADDIARQNADFKRRQNERERVEAADKAALDERCARLRHEYNAFSLGGRVFQMNDKGERVYMEDANRDARLAQLKDQMRGCP